MRLAWLTDIHLEFVSRPDVEAFAREVRAEGPDSVLIGGDIATAAKLVAYLELLIELLRTPIYFVLGNHDYYGGSIAAVRAEVDRLVRRRRELTWLTTSGPVPLTARTALVGHDGWGDGGFGNAAGSPVALNDFELIEELRLLTYQWELLAVLRRLGEEAAEHFRSTLPLALRDHEHILVLTHVPPFREAAWHEGRESDEDHLPYFACRAAGRPCAM